MQKFLKTSNKIYFLFILFVFILGIYLRTKVYLTNQSFWHDECALAWNIINKSYTNLFQPLRFLQSAPVLFLLSTKFMVNIFGSKEYVFRFIPYISSVISIFVFYFLSIKTLKTKISIALANLIFATSFPLYYYSSEFKPYSSDVLFCILSFICCNYLNKKTFITYSIILSLFFWFSFPTVFIVSGIILLFIFDKSFNLKEKTMFLIPQILSGSMFYAIFFKNMFNTHKNGMVAYWNNEFINIHNFGYLIEESFKFMFNEHFFLLILSFAGLFIFIKEKHKFGKLSLLSILILLSVSMVKLYPFSGRLIIFLIPIIILLITKTFDKKHYVSTLFLLIFLFGFYPQIKNTSTIIAKNNYVKNNPNPREIALYLSKNTNTTDLIYVNQESNSDFLYYKNIYNVKNKEFIETPQYIKVKDKVWFFLPNNPQKTYNLIKKEYKIIYENKNNNSLLIYAEKIK